MKIQILNWRSKAAMASLLFGLAAMGESSHDPSPRAEQSAFTEAHRFVFYAVLEGCFEDGLETEDVARMLLKDDRSRYMHFVYACPLCTPAIHALEVYRSRPAHFYGRKDGRSTFGSGLTPELKRRLYSGQSEERLAAINSLVNRWVARRKALLRLSAPEQTQLQQALEAMRKTGMAALKQWAASEPTQFKKSPFASVEHCAVCDGACGLMLRFPGGAVPPGR